MIERTPGELLRQVIPFAPLLPRQKREQQQRSRSCAQKAGYHLTVPGEQRRRYTDVGNDCASRIISLEIERAGADQGRAHNQAVGRKISGSLPVKFPSSTRRPLDVEPAMDSASARGTRILGSCARQPP